jgi:hypothetical protein
VGVRMLSNLENLGMSMTFAQDSGEGGGSVADKEASARWP